MDKDKNEVLTRFENTKDDEIFIIASCATIGEGVDTKNANMCVLLIQKRLTQLSFRISDELFV